MKIYVKNESGTQIESNLKRLSVVHGGAWVAVHQVFSLDIEYRRYGSPSKIPDCLYELVVHAGGMRFADKPIVGYKGKIVGFSASVVERAQNRGLTKD